MDDNLNVRRLLIVEDDVEVRSLIEEQCSKIGFQFLSASNGREAFELLQTEVFDAVISDIRMPEMNGIELLEQLRLQQNETPFVILTGSSDKDYAVAAVRLGALDFVDKPFSGAQLRKVITRAVEIGIRRRKLLNSQAEGDFEAVKKQQRMVDLLKLSNHRSRKKTG
jgi:two-component system, NtrC family, response regulator AtoC